MKIALPQTRYPSYGTPLIPPPIARSLSSKNKDTKTPSFKVILAYVPETFSCVTLFQLTVTVFVINSKQKSRDVVAVDDAAGIVWNCVAPGSLTFEVILEKLRAI